MSTSNSIDSVLNESRVFNPSDAFVKQANISGMPAYQAMVKAAQDDYEGYWAKLARELIEWKKPFSKVLDESNAPFFKWFEDGNLNVSYNCLDRHLATQADKAALIFEADDGKVSKVTYRELHGRVSQFANGLKSRGIKKGDRVVIYMPMSVEAVVAMQACARIGAIHSVVFGGFSSKSLHERITDAQAVAVITADGQMRGGKTIPLKNAVDDALAMGGCDSIHSVIVYRRTGGDVAWDDDIDLWYHDLFNASATHCEPEWVGAEHPLFILYTSGSTGKPKGVQHSSGGYLLGAIASMRWVFDYKPTDIFWCTADVGWITGHSYVAYGPLAVGATQVIFEGIPTYPDAGRFWKMIQDHKVTTFYTAPTAIRSLIKLGGELPKQYDLGSLRLLGSVGEPINPEAWMWYYTVVGQSRCPIVDTWWQTETGCHMISPLPGAVPAKPGSCTLPLPGIMATIVNEAGDEVNDQHGGFLVIKRPFPSQIRTIWGDPERYKKAYFPPEMQGAYLAGDSAHRDGDGYFWIMGRIDDVLNVSGHRLGTMEIESALVANPLVAEAAVVGKPHEIKGEAIVAFVVLKGDRPKDSAGIKKIAEDLRNWVGKEIGPIAKPDEIRFGDNLPKTRSGKIMRRLLRAIAKGEEITQDTSTLENPAILEQLKEVIK
ncbi:MAG: acetate--CoA ligase [Gallionellales bacterium 35-53-114]|jgi:acetyl-CoA synthetase|nr:MAG: acetate--CoA ligase [Gallionellales bacterium 35-53-114]OYZ65459.1 MAG: acetate--CoA ligase [Gallionellales bacterium 24-53-125]OZB08365.1 MAG: acetate--CoA ligase [Gallionellales bacterium 39-52-133]HQS58308.1 acetate--CoA ligase [Gallionellaceae bacterium]HQS73863.1 acetate--CoA ligase [Gallionellaceae bacterium]